MPGVEDVDHGLECGMRNECAVEDLSPNEEHVNHSAFRPLDSGLTSSHSIVLGGLVEMSKQTRLTPFTSLRSGSKCAPGFHRASHPIGRHPVLTLDDAERDRVFVGALVAHHPDGANREENGE